MRIIALHTGHGAISQHAANASVALPNWPGKLAELFSIVHKVFECQTDQCVALAVYHARRALVLAFIGRIAHVLSNRQPYCRLSQCYNTALHCMSNASANLHCQHLLCPADAAAEQPAVREEDLPPLPVEEPEPPMDHSRHKHSHKRKRHEHDAPPDSSAAVGSHSADLATAADSRQAEAVADLDEQQHDRKRQDRAADVNEDQQQSRSERKHRDKVRDPAESYRRHGERSKDGDVRHKESSRHRDRESSRRHKDEDRGDRHRSHKEKERTRDSDGHHSSRRQRHDHDREHRSRR